MREGTDVVVFTWGALVQRSLLAAQQAERDGISVAVVDLRSIIPYDWDTIAAYTRKTNRVIVAHEDQLTCGFGAEIAARISEELFEYLDAPVKRVAALDCPVAYAPVLEEVILPGSRRRPEGDQDARRLLGAVTETGRADRLAPDATIRQPRGGRRPHVRPRAGRDLRAARAERRRQDDDAAHARRADRPLPPAPFTSTASR